MAFYSPVPLKSPELRVHRLSDTTNMQSAHNVVFIGPDPSKSRLIELLIGSNDHHSYFPTPTYSSMELQTLRMHPVDVRLSKSEFIASNFNLIDTPEIRENGLPLETILAMCYQATQRNIRTAHAFLLVLDHGRIEESILRQVENLIDFIDLNLPSQFRGKCYVKIVITGCDGLTKHGLESLYMGISSHPILSKLSDPSRRVSMAGMGQSNICLVGLDSRQVENGGVFSKAYSSLKRKFTTPKPRKISEHIWSWIKYNINPIDIPYASIYNCIRPRVPENDSSRSAPTTPRNTFFNDAMTVVSYASAFMKLLSIVDPHSNVIHYIQHLF